MRRQYCILIYKKFHDGTARLRRKKAKYLEMTAPKQQQHHQTTDQKNNPQFFESA